MIGSYCIYVISIFFLLCLKRISREIQIQFGSLNKSLKAQNDPLIFSIIHIFYRQKKSFTFHVLDTNNIHAASAARTSNSTLHMLHSISNSQASEKFGRTSLNLIEMDCHINLCMFNHKTYKHHYC